VWVTPGSILSTIGKRWMEHVANLRDKCVQVLVSKPQGKSLLVSPRRRWENNKKDSSKCGVWDVD